MRIFWLTALLVVSLSQAQAIGQNNGKLLKVSCEIAFAYYDNDMALMTELIREYGNPIKFNQDRVDKIQKMMSYRMSTATRLSRFHCISNYDKESRIRISGGLLLESPVSYTDLILNWGFVIVDGVFDRIVLDEKLFVHPKVKEDKQST